MNLTKLMLLNFFFFFIFFSSIYYKTKIINKSNYIFTFWEPRNKLPGYLRLALMTWRKYLINYKIILLDYINLPSYLDSNIISKIICKNLSLPIQADAIRVAILKKYGGIWMDVDTIITKSDILNIINKLKKFELGLLGDKDGVNIGFIYAKKNSKILKEWLNGIIEHIKVYKQIIYLNNYYQSKAIINAYNSVRIWNYLGNGIIDPLLKKAKGKQFLLIDKIEINAFPELKYHREMKNVNKQYLYNEYYFSQGKAENIVNSSKGLILLHNSWTPEKYKKMSEEEFIKQNIKMSNLFKLLLNKI